MPGKALRVLLCACACLMAARASALGVGDITLHSALNQPLDADIELLDVGDLDAEEIKVGLAGADAFAAAGVERLQFLQELRFRPVLQGRAGNRIQVSSSRPVQEPYLNFLVEVARPNGRIVREFTVLLDPLGYAPRPAPARAASTTQWAPSAAQPRRRAPVALSPALLRPGEEYLIRPSDSLWAISGRLRGGNADRAQLMEALYQLNPQAFVGADRHRLKAGQRLRLPAGYQAPQEAPAVAPDAVLELLPPAAAVLAEDTPATLAEAQRQADAEAELLARQRAELSQRMDDLQRQLQALQEQLQQRDRQVSELQQQLARRQAAKPAAPPVAVAASTPSGESAADSEHWRWLIILLLVLALFGLLLWRRRREAPVVAGDQPKRRMPLRRAPPVPAAEARAATPPPLARQPATASAVPSGPPVAPVPAPAPGAAPRGATAPADKLDGADIYIAYGRYGQARDLLRQVLAEQPQRLSARMKLLLVLAELGDATGFDALAAETLANGGSAAAIDELRGRYPALLRMPATEAPAATMNDDDWSDLPLVEPPAAQQPDASSGADGFGDLNLDLDLDWGALENPLDNPDLPRRATVGRAEPPEEEALAFESNLHELPDVAEYEHLQLDEPEPAATPAEEASASLDRARACIDSGDLDQASRILRLVAAHGDPWQKAEARELLALIA
ncbi:FimV/HubP family polar landmark protein [Pseudomonas paraeruginosa]|uniref:Pilus assembly protein FimV n=1 Tax=Pseudomonas aeruginosa TaxID=287 RepID=A0ABD7JVJ6_PSEAI|nr:MULTISPECIES: FimV/HubP family polar landmark protein [Pseudomonas aeruginosa group]RTR90389.1 pilus assembly protein FimV [Pseudomonas paraeruginosa]RTS40478.1 pilus assembly protein FimV [Pseudomonas aeruginosa]